MKNETCGCVLSSTLGSSPVLAGVTFSREVGYGKNSGGRTLMMIRLRFR